MNSVNLAMACPALSDRGPGFAPVPVSQAGPKDRLGGHLRLVVITIRREIVSLDGGTISGV